MFFAAGADQFANAVSGNLVVSIRGAFAHLGRSGNGFIHDLQNIRAAGFRHVNGFSNMERECRAA